MSDIVLLLIGIGIGLAMKVLMAFLDGLVALFEKDKKEQDVPRS
jgi:hypothetical protein